MDDTDETLKAFASALLASMGEHSLLQQWLTMPYWSALAVASAFWLCVLALAWCLPFVSVEFKKQGADRMMSLVHAFLVTSLGVLVECSAEPACNEGTSWVRAPMVIFLGYILVDFFSMLVCDVINRWRALDVAMFVHHIFIFTMFSIGCTLDVGVYFGSTLLINEASTPFLTLMWYLTYMEMKDSSLFVVNGLVFVLVFFLCRIAFIPFSFYQFAKTPGQCGDGRFGAGPKWLMIMGYICIFLLNLMWFKKLVQGALKKLGVLGNGQPRPQQVQEQLLSEDMRRPLHIDGAIQAPSMPASAAPANGRL
eukprot:TRINITY_DN111257_c0_g1_i1.p1 TRINITY_DN111257_c0_g1~~TRINITY_DN111257_c0_g1_i1.p1  ORF type:complete len:309 (+),score=63.44 TRINITY_DN111257_c0_g1_i1:29-955(+)